MQCQSENTCLSSGAAITFTNTGIPFAGFSNANGVWPACSAICIAFVLIGSISTPAEAPYNTIICILPWENGSYNIQIILSLQAYLKKFYKADMKHCAFTYSFSSGMTSLWTGRSGGHIPVGDRDVSHETQWGLHLGNEIYFVRVIIFVIKFKCILFWNGPCIHKAWNTILFKFTIILFKKFTKFVPSALPCYLLQLIYHNFFPWVH